jgi:hypothetical protein
VQIVTGFAVDPKHLRELKVVAKREGQSVSALVRRAMSEFLARDRRAKWADRRLETLANAPVAPASRRAVADED